MLSNYFYSYAPISGLAPSLPTVAAGVRRPGWTMAVPGQRRDDDEADEDLYAQQQTGLRRRQQQQQVQPQASPALPDPNRWAAQNRAGQQEIAGYMDLRRRLQDPAQNNLALREQDPDRWGSVAHARFPSLFGPFMNRNQDNG